ncbi:MAG: tRNA lysidine(34) synthetase TilS [Desulfuromonadales bacterium]
MKSPGSELLTLLDRTIRELCLFQPDDTIIVAISGGADSTALLDLLGRLPGYRLGLVAAHLNHSLRGDNSDSDEEFCRRLAARYSIPFESRRVNVKELAESGRMNLEDAGRRARIAFLDELLEKYAATAVALAHHADDQAETVLMRLLRGSGMSGLSGMSYCNARGYVRPLLEISRSQIEQYLKECCLEWREDASNHDATYLRNRIRHELLPHLEQYNPAIRSCLVATASLLRDDEALLGDLAERLFIESSRMEEGTIVFRAGQLRTLGCALRRRVLRNAFTYQAGSLEGLSRRHIDAICAMIDSARPNSRLALPQRVTAVREYDRLLFKRTPEAVPGTFPGLQIPGPGYYLLPAGGSLSIEVSEAPDDFCTLPGHTAFLNLDKTPFPWQVRTFRPGDRMTPLGMSGSKKVKDIFIDRKIPSSDRRNIPLLFCNDELIWIAGVCVSEKCRIDTASASAIQVAWHV